MKVSFDCPDKINGLLTITVEEGDFKDEVENQLKQYRKQANVPGFRRGMAPIGLIRRQFGTSVKMDAVNKIVGQEIDKYITDNKIDMLGTPLPSEKQEPVEIEKDAPYTFMFDVAVAPQFDIELTDKDTVDYYDVTVDDKLVDKQVEGFAQRFGQNTETEEYLDGDTLKGDIRELDEQGNTKEGGLTVEGAFITPNYLNDDDQKKLFAGAKVGDIITFNPYKAYNGSAQVASLLKVEREEKENYKGDFSYQVTSVQHFQAHAVDQELFDMVYGKDNVKDEADFRAKIQEGLHQQLTVDQDYRLLQDLRKYAEDKVGQLTFPDALLKRVMKLNNKDKDDEFIDKNYEPSIKELTWSLIRNKLAEKAAVKVGDDDVKAVAREVARAQFAQYGMTNIGDEYIDNYANEILKQGNAAQQFAERAVDEKLTASLKAVVTLNHKAISIDEFNEMMSAKA